jgi:uncharacterized protein YndB with AHSA1/START domain
VFQAWTDPQHLSRWFAPHGCSIEFRNLDLRPGGTFHACIRNPQYPECWTVGVYQEIAAPERLVYTMAMANEQGQRVSSPDAGKDSDWPEETTVTVTFSEQDGKTLLTLRQTVSEALAKRTGAYPSWLEMLDRLSEILPAS